MSIERDLRKLQAAKPKPGDRLPRGSRPTIGLSQTDRAPTPDADFQRTYNRVFKTSGYATIGQANDFAWMPQRALEIRNAARSAIDLGDQSGAIGFQVEHAQVYAVNATGAVTLNFDVGDIPDIEDRSGLDIEFLVLIENPQGFAISLTVDHWAPYDAAPNLQRAGFYEILVAILKFPTRQIVRAYPCIQPPVTP